MAGPRPRRRRANRDMGSSGDARSADHAVHPHRATRHALPICDNPLLPLDMATPRPLPHNRASAEPPWARPRSQSLRLGSVGAIRAGYCDGTWIARIAPCARLACRSSACSLSSAIHCCCALSSSALALVRCSPQTTRAADIRMSASAACVSQQWSHQTWGCRRIAVSRRNLIHTAPLFKPLPGATARNSEGTRVDRRASAESAAISLRHRLGGAG